MEPFLPSFERFLFAVQHKQWDIFIAMLDESAFVGALLPQTYITDFQEFLQSQAPWFQGNTGSFEYVILSAFESQDLGVGVARVIYENINTQGKPFQLRLQISFWFRKIQGRWILIYDQNTVLPADPT